MAVYARNRKVQNKNRCQNSHINHNEHLNNNSKKSLGRISNKELSDIIENFENKSQSNINNSQNSLFIISPSKAQNNEFQKEKNIQGSSKMKSSYNTRKMDRKLNKSYYLIKTEIPITKDSETNTKPLMSKTKVLSDSENITSPNNMNESISNRSYFNIKKFKTHKIEEMEAECVTLEKKIRVLKKDLNEMEHCLNIMKSIKESFGHEFAGDSKVCKANAIIIPKLNSSSNHSHRKENSKINKSSEQISKKTKGCGDSIDTNVKGNNDKEVNAMKDRLTCKSNSNDSQVSECTWVSSSFMNEASYNLITESSHDDKNESNNSGSMLAGITCNNRSEGFLKKLWKNVKSNIVYKRHTSDRNNNKSNKINSHTEKSTSYYFTANENLGI